MPVLLLSCPVSRRGNGAPEPTRCPDSASRVTAGPIHAAVGREWQGSGIPQHALAQPSPFPPPATPAHSASSRESPIDKYTRTSVTRNSRRVGRDAVKGWKPKRQVLSLSGLDILFYLALAQILIASSVLCPWVPEVHTEQALSSKPGWETLELAISALSNHRSG